MLCCVGDRRNENNYRMPQSVINRWTRICVTVLIGGIVVGMGAGAGGGAIGDVADERQSAALSVLSVALLIIGVVLLVLGAVGPILMGVRARVPMWLQLPVLGSSRPYVRRPDEDDPSAL